MGRLDYYDIRPAGLDAYLSYYGYHFSPAMADFATSRMKKSGGGKYEPMRKDEVDDLLRRTGVSIDNDFAHDTVYVANMVKSDRWGGSVRDEAQLALAVKEELDDADGYDGKVFSRFLADCNGKGVPIVWEDMI